MRGFGSMDHKLDKDFLDQLIIDKKLLGLNEKNFGNWGNWFIGFHVVKEAKKEDLYLQCITK